MLLYWSIHYCYSIDNSLRSIKIVTWLCPKLNVSKPNEINWFVIMTTTIMINFHETTPLMVISAYPKFNWNTLVKTNWLMIMKTKIINRNQSFYLQDESNKILHFTYFLQLRWWIAIQLTFTFNNWSMITKTIEHCTSIS